MLKARGAGFRRCHDDRPRNVRSGVLERRATVAERGPGRADIIDQDDRRRDMDAGTACEPFARCQTLSPAPAALRVPGLLEQDRVRFAAGQLGRDGCDLGDAVETTHSPSGRGRRNRHQSGVRFEQRREPSSQRFGDVAATVFECQDRSTQGTVVRAECAYRYTGVRVGVQRVADLGNACRA